MGRIGGMCLATLESEPMSTRDAEPHCWNCLTPASEIPLLREGPNWICGPCQKEIDDLITTGKDWSHLTDYAERMEN